MNIKKMTNTIKKTNFKLPGQTNFYKGKVRDVYTVNNEILVMVASDRISAFDHVLPELIPLHKELSINKVMRGIINGFQILLNKSR